MTMSILSGKVAFVTGAARGQGRAHAIKLASLGVDIIALDICEQIASVPYPMSTPEDLAETAELVRAAGGRIVAEQADVRDRDSLSAVLSTGLERFGRLDIVIANAGIAPMTSNNGWQDVIDVNLSGVYHTVAVSAPTLIDQAEGGAVVLISSAAGLTGVGTNDAGSIGYTASKHGVVGLMRVYANILAPHNIRVNSVHPSAVDTPMINNDFARQWVEKSMQSGGASSPMNALPVAAMESNDIAEAVLWLASDAARYVTGVALPVDAGFVVNR